MEVFTDGALIARILLTLVTGGYSVIPVLADLNMTHATNPTWTPHARFHVVWQVSSYVGFGMFALALIWAPGPQITVRLYLASSFALIVYSAFFVALATMKLYGGRAFDANGYAPLKLRFANKPRFMDLNVTVFSAFSAMLIATLLLLSRAGLAD
jgi:hypothetical protein